MPALARLKALGRLRFNYYTANMLKLLLTLALAAGPVAADPLTNEDLIGVTWDGRGSAIGPATDSRAGLDPASVAGSPVAARPAAEQANAPTSLFDEVRDVLRDKDVPQPGPEGESELRGYANGDLPRYEVTVESFFKGSHNLLEKDAKRTVTEQADYYDRITKRLHPNGICFTGTWEITRESPYTGYFTKGAKARMIARASVALSATERGDDRGFGFAGKLFPAEETGRPARTANFFLVDQLTGTDAQHYLDVAMTNEPDLGFTWSLRLLKTISDALTKADVNPMFRPLYPISELELSGGESPRTPKWMMIKPSREMGRSAERDFRRELDIRNYPHGLIFNVYVSDSTRNRKSDAGWREIGRIVLRESFVSYGCDRRLHFPHPKIR